jgi:aspartate/methionine/tyrosine aminotransferase
MWINAECSDSVKFAENFLSEKKVAVAPGSTFGSVGEGYVRISLASDSAVLEAGVTRLAEYILASRT